MRIHYAVKRNVNTNQPGFDHLTRFVRALVTINIDSDEQDDKKDEGIRKGSAWKVARQSWHARHIWSRTSLRCAPSVSSIPYLLHRTSPDVSSFFLLYLWGTIVFSKIQRRISLEGVYRLTCTRYDYTMTGGERVSLLFVFALVSFLWYRVKWYSWSNLCTFHRVSKFK